MNTLGLLLSSSIVPQKPTMADGIAVGTIGNIPLEVIKDYVDNIVLVDESEVRTVPSVCPRNSS